MRFLFLFLCFTVNAQTIVLDSLKTFPDSEGYGRFVMANSTGTIYEVTSTAEFNTAINATGERIIYSKEGLEVDFGNNLTLSAGDGNCFIIGATWVGTGITLKQTELRIQDSNVVVAGIKSRHGDGSVGASNNDCIRVVTFSGDISGFNFYHNSLMWASDENFDLQPSSGNLSTITIQGNIIAEGGKGLLAARLEDMSIIENAFILNFERNPRVQPKVSSNGFNFEFRNNLIHGYGFGGTLSYGVEFTMTNNVYLESSEETLQATAAIVGTSSGEFNPGDTYAFIQDNIFPGSQTEYNSGLSTYIETTNQDPTTGYQDYAASLVEANIIDVVGPPQRDADDDRVIAHVGTGDGEHVADIGPDGYPTTTAGTADTDDDVTHLPDTWTTLHGITSVTQVKSSYTIDGITIQNDAGYTAFWIFWFEQFGVFDRMETEDAPPESAVKNAKIRLGSGKGSIYLGATKIE